MTNSGTLLHVFPCFRYDPILPDAFLEVIMLLPGFVGCWMLLEDFFGRPALSFPVKQTLCRLCLLSDSPFVFKQSHTSKKNSLWVSPLLLLWCVFVKSCLSCALLYFMASNSAWHWHFTCAFCRLVYLFGLAYWCMYFVSALWKCASISDPNYPVSSNFFFGCLNPSLTFSSTYLTCYLVLRSSEEVAAFSHVCTKELKVPVGSVPEGNCPERVVGLRQSCNANAKSRWLTWLAAA